MHVTLDSVLAATPAYIDPPVDHAGRDVDGDSLNLLQDLSTLHDGFSVGAAILPVALSRWVERNFRVGHTLLFTIEGLYRFFINLHLVLAALFNVVLIRWIPLLNSILHGESINVLGSNASSNGKGYQG